MRYQYRCLTVPLILRAVVVGTFLYVGFDASSYAQQNSSRPLTNSPCQLGALTPAGYPSLTCFDLIPTPAAGSVGGRVELLRTPSPFTVNVSREGIHTYRIKIILEDLPPPDSFGPYRAYVAWLTSPELRPVAKLGVVGNGENLLGEVNLNKYIILISAEQDPASPTRNGRLILRARSPSSFLEAHDLATLAPVAVLRGNDMSHAHDHGPWRMPPAHPMVSMAPGMQSLKPDASPFVPQMDGRNIPAAAKPEILMLEDGDSIDLVATLVTNTIGGAKLLMYGYNGQYPGPLLSVKQRSTIQVKFKNELEWPTAVHWHGVRLENAFDGVPGLTQDPVKPGETFEYRITFPDAGIYWYHPHHREDVQQDLGLYGNMIVSPQDESYWTNVENEAVLIIDDVLLDDRGFIPYGRERSNFAMMGRFGNTMLVNGKTDYVVSARTGETTRFFVTNTSNTRVFNVSLDDHALRVIASDVSKYEREEWAESIVIAPAERYVFDVQFTRPGTYAIVNRVQGIDHLAGVFFPEVDTLALVDVKGIPGTEAIVDGELREHADVSVDIDAYREHFDRPPDKELRLTLEVGNMDPVVKQLMQLDPVFFNPVEWSGTMPMMNWQSTPEQVEWIIEDLATGDRNMEIDWSFSTGDVIKIRLANDRDAFHSMQHPVHLHGQRFLILEQDGVVNENLVWKDTILLPVGSTADILLDISNPGDWMIHCHIAEHLEAGMKMVFSAYGENKIDN